MVPALFWNMNREERLALLANHIVNNEGHLPRSSVVSPLWHTFKGEFIELLTFSPFPEQNDGADEAREGLVESNESLSALLDETRRQLAYRHLLPFVDDTLH